MTKTDLQAKYPTFTIRSEPVPTCGICRGTGERHSRADRWFPCVCACLSLDGETRALAAETLQTTASKLRQEMG